MRKWIALGLAVFAVLSVPIAGQALAGGWAVVKLDTLPADVVAGRPLSVGFTVLQHGTHPFPGLSPIVKAEHASSGEKVEVAASDQGTPGHYVAEITFANSGTWNWVIDAFNGDHPMPPLNVLPPAVALDQGAAEAAKSISIAPAVKWSMTDAAPIERRLALGLAAAGVAMLASASVLGVRVLRRAPAAARG